jgi:hypothetical protein
MSSSSGTGKEKHNRICTPSTNTKPRAGQEGVQIQRQNQKGENENHITGSEDNFSIEISPDLL